MQFMCLYLGSTLKQVSGGMAVVSLCFRPISAFLLCKIWQERNPSSDVVNNVVASTSAGTATYSQKKSFGTIFTGSVDEPKKTAYQEIPSV